MGYICYYITPYGWGTFVALFAALITVCFSTTCTLYQMLTKSSSEKAESERLLCAWLQKLLAGTGWSHSFFFLHKTHVGLKTFRSSLGFHSSTKKKTLQSGKMLAGWKSWLLVLSKGWVWFKANNLHRVDTSGRDLPKSINSGNSYHRVTSKVSELCCHVQKKKTDRSDIKSLIQATPTTTSLLHLDYCYTVCVNLKKTS